MNKVIITILLLLLTIFLLSGRELNKNVNKKTSNNPITIEENQPQHNSKNEEENKKSEVGHGLYNGMNYYFIKIKGEKLGLEGEVTDTKIYELLGKPEQKREWKTSIYGLHKELVYNGIKLLMIDPDKDSHYNLIELEINSDEFVTYHGIKVRRLR